MVEALLTPSHKETSTGRLLSAGPVEPKVQALVRIIDILKHLPLHVLTVEVVQEDCDQNNRNPTHKWSAYRDPVDHPKSKKNKGVAGSIHNSDNDGNYQVRVGAGCCTTVGFLAVLSGDESAKDRGRRCDSIFGN
jgi:hypothetical protein